MVMVTWIGDRLLGRAERFALAAKLGLSRSAARQVTPNPPGCVAEQAFGLLRGMVSPFLPVGYGTGLRAVGQHRGHDLAPVDAEVGQLLRRPVGPFGGRLEGVDLIGEVEPRRRAPGRGRPLDEFGDRLGVGHAQVGWSAGAV